ncbi:MAG: hypothetical protein M0R46_16460 [Candidatus Muirbacterium halophilum]|nr:hypothetical protein [Candidatus Muirbacterium halophilum]
MNAYFIDIDTLLSVDNKVWIVDKSKPSIPILKINKSDFNLIKNGIYKYLDNKITMNDQIYYLPNNIFNTLKIKVKNYKADISNLAFSLQEFLNTELIENIDFTINNTIIQQLKNKSGDIHIICSKNNKAYYEKMISKMEKTLQENGLIISKYHFVSETFMNRNQDNICLNVIKIILNCTLNLDNNTQQQYDKIYLFSDNDRLIKQSSLINDYLLKLIKNDNELKNRIKEELNIDHYLITYKVTTNKVKPFIVNKILITLNNLIKTFESFNV